MPEKAIIYQVFTRLHTNRNTTRKAGGTIEENGCGKLNDFTPTLLKQISRLGVSHIWYTGVIRHATMTDYSQYDIPRQHPAVVKGRAGSPYAITDYYDIDPDLAVDIDRRMEEFSQLVARTHEAGMKVIIDFVPNHVARQYKSIAKPRGVKDLGAGDNPQNGFDPQNNFYYCPGQRFTPYFDLYHGETQPYTEEPAKATGNDCFHNAPGKNDWYETVKLNYGVDYYAGVTPSSLHIAEGQALPDTWQKMTDILLFWAAKGIDGFRCDMAEMVPAEFWSYATQKVKAKYPELLFIGEVYNPGEYRHWIASGFDYLYDKVGMYDTMFQVIRHQQSTQAITGAWQATDDIRQHMLYFLENHDELRIGSDFFAADGRKAVPALVVNALQQQNPFMLYAGQEYGERGMDQEGFSGHDGRTTIFDYWNIDTLTRAAKKQLTTDEQQLYDTYKKVLAIARNEKAISEGESYDLMYVNQQYHRQYMFLRKAKSSLLLVVANFDDQQAAVDVRIPAHAFEFLGMKEKVYKAHDLLTDAAYEVSLKADQTVHVEVDARSAAVLKLQSPRTKQ